MAMPAASCAAMLDLDIPLALAKAGAFRIDYFESGAMRSKTFAEIGSDVSRAVALLGDRGIRPGDRVGIYGSNSYEMIVFDLACFTAGIVTVHLSDIDEQRLNQARSAYDLKLVATSSSPIAPADIGLAGIWNYDCGPMRQVPFAADAPFTFKFTSGSSGKPKAIEVRAAHLAELMETTQALFAFGPQDTFLIQLPYHIFLQRCYVYGALLSGYNIVAIPLAIAPALLHKHPPTVIVAVPQIFRSLMEFAKVKAGPKAGPAQLKLAMESILGSKVRYLLSGAAAMPVHLLEWYQAIGHTIFEAYGMSEIGMIAMNYPGQCVIGSVGRPLPNKEVVLDKDGVVLVRSAFATNVRYFSHEDQAHNQAYRSDGFVYTGDIGRFDENGFLFLEGRSSTVLVLANGKKVQPESIEAYFEGITGVEHCIVFGENRAYLTALVTSKVSSPELQQLLAGANEALPEGDRLARIAVTDKVLSAPHGGLTEGLKKDRKRILEIFENEIEALFSARIQEHH
jgi:long-chain acyl-CoA synthetase